MKEKIRKILPIEINFEIKNFLEYLKNKTIKFKTTKNKIILCDAASYNNLGDQAISFAISCFCKEEFSEYEFVEITEREFLRNYRYLKKSLKPDDVICLNGGGNMGNLYPKYEAIRRKIIKNFKNNKIIIFPQTIDYEQDNYGNKQLEKSKKIYNSNENLVICAREKRSYEFMKKIYKNVIMVSDIVFYLYDFFDMECIKKRKCVGVCLREDKESILSNDIKNKIYSSLNEKNISIRKLTTMSEFDYIDNHNRESCLIEKIREFAECDYIITDRLHGMIFALLCNLPCFVFDNSNKKVSGVYNTVNNYFKNVEILSEWDLDKIEAILDKKSEQKIEFDKSKVYCNLINEVKVEK